MSDPIRAFLSFPYGRTPEEWVYWQTFESAVREVATKFFPGMLEIHAARDEVEYLVLKENVKRLLDSCDFTIAVITGYNPNVLWEVGYT